MDAADVTPRDADTQPRELALFHSPSHHGRLADSTVADNKHLGSEQKRDKARFQSALGANQQVKRVLRAGAGVPGGHKKTARNECLHEPTFHCAVMADSATRLHSLAMAADANAGFCAGEHRRLA